MNRAQSTCPVCRRELHTGGHQPMHGQFALHYEGGRIELCSWECFCLFSQEPERHYVNYRQETGNVVPRLEGRESARAYRGYG